MDTSDLKGKTVLVTGAARGLGAAFACVLAKAGCNVIMTGRLTEQLTSTAEGIRLQSGHSPETHLLDLAETGAANGFGEKIAAAYPKLDILINNGAQWLAGRMDDYDAYSVNTTINAAATGTFLLTRKLVPSLEASGAGDIVNIVSTSGIANRPNSGAAVPYRMAKHAQTGMTDGLREELKGRPVRVHAIYPPDLETVTPLDEEAWNAPRKAGDMVTSRDVVEAALFALTRPRNVTMASIVLDSDSDHTWG
ncbi:MAG: SDR family oxidoreductase [Anderseniella sp.]|nr:SDR family oxidoreductase [Anderseniella sp.]